MKQRIELLALLGAFIAIVLSLTAFSTRKTNQFLGSATADHNFPTSLSNVQDGETVQAGDWNNIEGAIGTLTSTSSASLNYKMNNVTSSFLSQLLGQINTWTLTQTFNRPPIDSGGTKFTTSTQPGSFQWAVLNETTGQIDGCVYIFPATSTIRSIRAVNQTTGTVTFNLGIASSASALTSSLQYLFTSNQTINATTNTVNIPITGSSSVPTGYCLTYYTATATSSKFFITGTFTTP